MSPYDPYQPSNYATPFSMFQTLPSDVPESTIGSQTHIGPYPCLEGTVVPLRSPESADMSLPDIPHVAQLRTNGMEGECPVDPRGNPSWDAIMAEHAIGVGDTRDCITRAASVLQTMRDPRISCIRSRTPPLNHPQSLDATLDDGRTAIETVKEIMACPCAQGLRIALLLVLIIQQVLSSELEKIGSILTILARYAQGMDHQPDELILQTYIDSLQTAREKALKSIQQQDDC
ncbi:hypothetical protein APSETT444_008065 [Aspergillus pseudonomiae]